MRKIAVFTGTRAEYGLLYWIIKGLHDSSDAELKLIVGGMHLSTEYGYTVDQILKDEIPISECLEFLVSSKTSVGIAKSMGLAMISSSEYFARHKPDILVILGDRFEAIAVAQSAMIARIPIAHIHGGEITEGLIDEAIRHSLTKMSHLHFPATESYSDRIKQLGENPEHIFNFGAPGLDSINNLKLLEKNDISKAIGFELNKKYFIVTHHPVTLSSSSGTEGLTNLLSALDEYPQYQVIISYPNADTNSRELIELIDNYYLKNKKRIFLSRSLGQLIYLSSIKHCEMVIGNSSSGLIEAPAFKVPTVNIGNRQKGRTTGESVINCDDSKTSITNAINKALSNDFKKKLKNTMNPYGNGGASEKIVEKIINHPLENIIYKKFYDFKK